MEIFKEIIEISLKEKKGITVFVKGQTIGGAVTKIDGTEAIELRSQMYGKIIIRVESIDAIALS